MAGDAADIEGALVDLLRERAKTMGLTQGELAVRAGVSQSRVSRVFSHGVALTVEVAVALCGALETELDEAYGEVRGKTPHSR